MVIHQIFIQVHNRKNINASKLKEEKFPNKIMEMLF